MLQPVNNPCQVYWGLSPIGDRNQDTPHPEVPSSTERDTKNTDDDDGSAYRSLYHVLTHLWNVSTIYSTVILSTCPDNRSKIKT